MHKTGAVYEGKNRLPSVYFENNEQKEYALQL